MFGSTGRADRELPRPTTPRGLHVALATIAVLVVLLVLVGGRAIAEQQRAVETVGRSATPQLASAEGLYVELADADAVASTSFLRAGLEPADLRDRYQADIHAAGERLAELGADLPSGAAARAALTVVEQQLPVYTGRVEAARANNRLELPVGAASLRLASEQMRTEILPAATEIYRSAADAVDRGQRTGASADAVIAVGVGAALVLAALIATQVFLTLRTRRYLNVWLLAATVVVLAVGGVVAAGLAGQRDATVRSRERGSDPLLALATARILALRSMNDQNLHLIERGTEPRYPADFAEVTGHIGGSDGLLAVAAGAPVDDGAPARIDVIGRLHDEFLAVHERVDRLLADGAYRDAVELATTEQVVAAAALDAAIAGELDVARAALDHHTDDAARIGWWLVAALALGGVAVVALSAVGIQIRLREYR